LEVDQALQEMAVTEARRSQIVEMRFFGGLTDAEIASVLNVSTRTVRREWHMARAWLVYRFNKT
jgi:DNA-directed RNA polymerase specialized sigma24 family protein